jgi:hypothetical protein
MTDVPAGFVATTVPARIAELGCTFVRPHDWVQVELPNEPVDFTDPAALAPVVVVMAPFAAIVFAVSARPAYDNGAVADWLQYLARHHGTDPGPVEREDDLPHPAVACWGGQNSDGTLLRLRAQMFEDGGRLVQIGVMAPQALWDSVHDTLRTMLQSFRLTTPRGSTVALHAADQALPPSSYGPYGARRAAMPAPAAPPTAEPQPEPEPEPEPTDDATTGPATSTTFAAVALADDAATLDQDHPVNQNLLQNGVGFAPRVAHVDTAAKCATVRSGALVAELTLPLGWHALDDGRRLLVHDAGGGVQIDLSRRAHEGRDHGACLAAVLPGLQSAWPNLQPVRLQVGGIECMVLHGIEEAGEPLAQVWLVVDAPRDQVLMARGTSKPADIGRMGDVAELVLRSVRWFEAAGAVSA